MAKCPYCEENLASVDIERMPLTSTVGNEFDGLSYSCPKCGRILSVGFDPVRQADYIVGRLGK